VTQPYRPLDEQWLLKVSDLERRVQALERAGAGQASSFAAHTTAASPLTVLVDTGASLTITRPGRYLCLAWYEFTVTAAAAGWMEGRITPTGHLSTSGTPALMDTLVAISSGSTCSGISIVSWQAAGSVKAQVIRGGGAATCQFTTSFGGLAAIRLGPA
jgi:hypothetical protein